MAPELEELISLFILRSKPSSSHEEVDWVLRDFFRFAAGYVSREIIVGYAEHLRGAGFAVESRLKRIRIVQAYWMWMQRCPMKALADRWQWYRPEY